MSNEPCNCGCATKAQATETTEDCTCGCECCGEKSEEKSA